MRKKVILLALGLVLTALAVAGPLGASALAPGSCMTWCSCSCNCETCCRTASGGLQCGPITQCACLVGP